MWTERKQTWLTRDLEERAVRGAARSRVLRSIPNAAWALNRAGLLDVAIALHRSWTEGYQTAEHDRAKAKEPDEIIPAGRKP